MEYSPGQTACLPKNKSYQFFKKIEIIPGTFSKHNGMKPEIKSRRKNGKFKNVNIKHFEPMDQRKKIINKLENISRKQKLKHNMPKLMGHSKSGTKRKVQ